jgi:predicted DNA-binding transcriptional regulator AlpA
MQRDEVLAMACVCTSTLYAWMSIGAFPKPVSLGPRRSNGYSGRAVWVRAEVEAWAQAKIDQARTAIADRPRYSARQAAHA